MAASSMSMADQSAWTWSSVDFVEMKGIEFISIISRNAQCIESIVWLVGAWFLMAWTMKTMTWEPNQNQNQNQNQNNQTTFIYLFFVQWCLAAWSACLSWHLFFGQTNRAKKTCIFFLERLSSPAAMQWMQCCNNCNQRLKEETLKDQKEKSEWSTTALAQLPQQVKWNQPTCH